MARYGLCKQTKEKVDSYVACFNCDHATNGDYIMGHPTQCDDFVEQPLKNELGMTWDEFKSMIPKETRAKLGELEVK